MMATFPFFAIHVFIKVITWQKKKSLLGSKSKAHFYFQLESLRKGEGLKKDEDETAKANTFDPGKTKYEKSNKKKQKLREGKLSL